MTTRRTPHDSKKVRNAAVCCQTQKVSKGEDASLAWLVSVRYCFQEGFSNVYSIQHTLLCPVEGMVHGTGQILYKVGVYSLKGRYWAVHLYWAAYLIGHCMAVVGSSGTSGYWASQCILMDSAWYWELLGTWDCTVVLGNVPLLGSSQCWPVGSVSCWLGVLSSVTTCWQHNRSTRLISP